MEGIFRLIVFLIFFTIGISADVQLVRGINSDFSHFHPHLFYRFDAFDLIADLHEGLYAYDPYGYAKPAIATHCRRISPRKWLLTLRENACFSNGERITAQDVVRSWQQLVSPQTGAQILSAIQHIDHAKDILKGQRPVSDLGIKAINQKQIRIQTTIPIAYLKEVLAHPTLCIVHSDPHITSGAFQLASYKPNHRIVIRKNHYYWHAVPIDQVVYRIIPHFNTLWHTYKARDIDFFDIPKNPGLFTAMKAKYPKEVHVHPMLGLYFLALNHHNPIFQDVRLREVISLAISRESLATMVGFGLKPMYHFYPEVIQTHTRMAYLWQEQSQQMRKAMAKKSIQEMQLQTPLSCDLMYVYSFANRKIFAFLQSELRDIGIQLKAIEVDRMSFLHKRKTIPFDLQLGQWHAGFLNDASSFLDLISPQNEENVGQYQSKTLNTLLKQALTTHVQKRKKTLDQLEHFILNDYAVIPLLTTTRAFCLNPKFQVQGFMFMSKDFIPVKED